MQTARPHRSVTSKHKPTGGGTVMRGHKTKTEASTPLLFE